MKGFYVSLYFCLLCTLGVVAQPQLRTTLPPGLGFFLYPINYANGTFRYLVVDYTSDASTPTTTAQIARYLIYNADGSLYKEVISPLLAQGLAGIESTDFITDKLVDDDAEVEFFACVFDRSLQNSNPGYLFKTVYIIDENGQVEFMVDSVSDLYSKGVVRVGSGYGMVISRQKAFTSLVQGQVPVQQWSVYTFPGSLVSEALLKKGPRISAPAAQAQEMRLFPNPGTSIYYLDLPPNMKDASLRVTDLQGKALMQTAPGQTVLDMSGMRPGTYYLHGPGFKKAIVRQ